MPGRFRLVYTLHYFRAPPPAVFPRSPSSCQKRVPFFRNLLLPVTLQDRWPHRWHPAVPGRSLLLHFQGSARRIKRRVFSEEIGRASCREGVEMWVLG